MWQRDIVGVPGGMLHHGFKLILASWPHATSWQATRCPRPGTPEEPLLTGHGRLRHRIACVLHDCWLDDDGNWISLNCSLSPVTSLLLATSPYGVPFHDRAPPPKIRWGPTHAVLNHTSPFASAFSPRRQCPRTCPSARATLCTYYRWFARPQHLRRRRPGPLLMQPLSARCMRVLLRFRMGAHSLPVVQGRRTGAPRAQRLCLLCDQRALGDERHMVFECPALQGVRDKYAALFVDGASTMQQFMWQQDVIGVLAHFVQDCFDLLDAPV